MAMYFECQVRRLLTFEKKALKVYGVFVCKKVRLIRSEFELMLR